MGITLVDLKERSVNTIIKKYTNKFNGSTIKAEIAIIINRNKEIRTIHLVKKDCRAI